MSEAMIWRKQPTNEAENKWTDRWTEGNLGGSWKRLCWITSSVNPVLAEVWFLAGFSFSNFSFGLLFLWPASVLSCPPFFLATCISVVVLVRPVQCVFPPQLRPKKANVAPVQKTLSFAASCDIAFHQFQLQVRKAGRTHHCKRFLACRRANAIFHQAPAPPHDTNARSNWYHFRLKAIGAQIPVFPF